MSSNVPAAFQNAQPVPQPQAQDTQAMTPPDIAKAINAAVQQLALVQKALMKQGGADSPTAQAVNQILGAIAEVEAYVESRGNMPGGMAMGPEDMEAAQVGGDQMAATAMEGGETPAEDQTEGDYQPPTSNPFKQAARGMFDTISSAASNRLKDNYNQGG